MLSSIFKKVKPFYQTHHPREHNDQALEFLRAVQTLYNSNKDWYQQAKDITSKFINQNSPKEINVSGESKKRALAKLESLDNSSPKNEYLDVFYELENIVVWNLFIDIIY